MKKLSTGIEGLDNILSGGLPSNHLYLVSGNPGTGKTTLALQFLLEGIKQGEATLYVTLSETKDELKAVGISHGLDLDQINIFDLTVSEDILNPADQYSVFHPSEVELDETTKKILDEVDRTKPTRIVFDSLSEIRLLASDPLRYRRQILALKQFFIGRQCTVLLLDDKTMLETDRQLESVVHGVIALDHFSPEFGKHRRRMSIVKLRGVSFQGGYHDYNIEIGGLIVFPRLVAAHSYELAEHELLPSGIEKLDNLLGGGLTYHTGTLILGPAGIGKSTLSAQYVYTALKRGDRAAIFLFDEGVHTFFSRTTQIGIDLQPFFKSGQLIVKRVDPVELSPGEFTFMVRQEVAKNNVRVVVIDSLNGYLNAMPAERHLIMQMHELLNFLNQQGVATFLILAQQGMVGQMTSITDLSYLSDNIIMFRYFESHGEVLQAISVVKKRNGMHERTIRQYKITSAGIEISEPLREFQGILTGVPTFVGTQEELVGESDDTAKG